MPKKGKVPEEKGHPRIQSNQDRIAGKLHYCILCKYEVKLYKGHGHNMKSHKHIRTI